MFSTPFPKGVAVNNILYGCLVDFKGCENSFTLEITEIENTLEGGERIILRELEKE